MSDNEANATPRTRLYQFGEWSDASEPTIPTARRDLYRWIAGHDVTLTPELSAQLQAEFNKHERYRATLANSMQLLIGELRSRASACLEGCESPANADYSQGYTQGLYRAYAEGAHEVLEALQAAERALSPTASTPTTGPE